MSQVSGKGYPALLLIVCAWTFFLTSAVYAANTDRVTFTSYNMYAYRSENMGTPPNGAAGTDDCYIRIEAEFPEDLLLTDGDAAAKSFVVKSGSSVVTGSYKSVSVKGKKMILDIGVTYMPGGVISFDTDEIRGLSCGGKTVYWPEDFITVVPTGLQFHVISVTVGTDTQPASTTIEIDHSANVRSMNHILWTSNGQSLKDGIGTDQTSPAHHHLFWNFTLATSAEFIKSGIGSLDGYTVSIKDDTVTLTAVKASEGEYLGIYNYDDNFLKEYGFTLADSVTGLPPQQPEQLLDIAKRGSVAMESTALWTGEEIRPEIVVTDGYHKGEYVCKLTEGVDYTLTYSNNIDVGTQALAMITGIGDYEGSSIEKYFSITKKIIPSMFEVDTGDCEYKGSAYMPAVKSLEGLVEGRDYKVQYLNNAFAGTAKVVISGAGNYSGVLEYPFEITARSITKELFTIETGTYVYNGSAHKPRVSSSLKLNKDYKVAYENNVNAGTARVVISGLGNYGGQIEADYTIAKAKLAKSLFYVDIDTKTYTGSPRKTLISSDRLKESDYQISYKNNVNAGTAEVTITGIGNYKGSLTYNYTITRKALARSMFKVSTESKTYTGKAIHASVTGKLKNGSDYSLSYSNCVKAGTASLKITGKGNYTGTITYSYDIKPSKPANIKAVSEVGKINLSWKNSGASRYNVYYRMQGNTAWKIKTISSCKTTITSLKKGKQYQVKVVALSGKYKAYSSIVTTGKVK